MRRKLTAIAASCAAVLGVGVITTSPANAAANPASVTFTCDYIAFLSMYTLSAGSVSGITGASNDAVAITNNSGATLTITAGSGLSSLSPTPIPSTGGSVGTLTLGTGAQSVTFNATGGNCNNKTATIGLTVSAGGGGGGGGGSSSSSASAPVETLSLAVAASGATCTGGNPTGYAGAWLTLPSADKCSQSGPTAKPGAKLLGWSTSANFPIARAQAQIDKKWGVIDEAIDGQRMIFIPGGMATFVSGSNNLFPVWSI